MQQKVSGFRRPFALYGRAEHSREISLQFDSEDASLRRQRDGVDQPSERLRRLGTRFWGLQGIGKRRHLLAVQFGHLRVQERRWLVCGIELRLHLFPARVERLHLGLTLLYYDLVVQHQVQKLLDPRADPLDLALARRQAGAPFHAEPVHLARELVAELVEELLVQELLLQGREHARFNLISADGQMVVAASLVACAEASEAVLAHHDESGAADATLRQAREQVLRAPRPGWITGGSDCVSAVLLALLRVRPLFVRDDTESGNFLPHPLGRRIQARNAFAGIGILHVAQPVPHQPADIQLVVQNPGSAQVVAADRARTPGAAERACDAFTIQVLRNLLRRNAGDELAEDPLDDRSLGRLDLAFARRHVSAGDCLDDPVSVAQAAGRLAVLDPATQSTVRFLGQVFQEEGVHRALESDVQMRDIAVGQRDDVDASKGEPLEEPGGVFLVSAEAVQRLGEDHIESTVQCIAHQCLEAGTKQRGAGYCMVGVFLRDGPALSFGKGPTDARLIGNGRVTQVVRRVARVDGDSHARVPQ